MQNGLKRWLFILGTIALAGIGCQCSAVGPGRFKLVLPEGFELREIYRVAAGRDLQLRHLNYRRDSLEDKFMKAMER